MGQKKGAGWHYRSESSRNRMLENQPILVKKKKNIKKFISLFFQYKAEEIGNGWEEYGKFIVISILAIGSVLVWGAAIWIWGTYSMWNNHSDIPYWLYVTSIFVTLSPLLYPIIKFIKWVVRNIQLAWKHSEE